MVSEKLINETLPACLSLREADKRFIDGLMQGIMLARQSPENKQKVS